jgi:hypothetical protein
MVASEDNEPGTGWNYFKWLNALNMNTGMTSLELSKCVVQTYSDYYSKNGIYPKNDITMSAIDLANIENVASSISTFSDYLIDNISVLIDEIKKARSKCLEYAPGGRYYNIDFIFFLDNLFNQATSEELRTQIITVRNIISSAIVANFAGTARKGNFGSAGLAIYFPRTMAFYKSDPYAEGGYEKKNTFMPVDFVVDQHWSDFLHAYLKLAP